MNKILFYVSSIFMGLLLFSIPCFADEYGKTFFMQMDNGSVLETFYDQVKSDMQAFGSGDEDVSDDLIIRRYTATDTGLTGSEIAEVCAMVCLDHPEFWWTSNNMITEYPDGVSMSTWAECATSILRSEISANIESNATKYLATINELSDTTIEDRARVLHDLIVLSATYDQTSAMNSSIAGVLSSGRGACLSYSMTVKYLLNQLGIESLVATGRFDNGDRAEDHAWNYIKDENGAYFLVDATMDDYDDQNYSVTDMDFSSYKNQYEILMKKHLIDRTYFKLDSSVFAQDHTPYTSDQDGLFYLYDLPDVVSKLFFCSDPGFTITDDTTQFELYDMLAPIVNDALLEEKSIIGFPLDSGYFGFINSALEEGDFKFVSSTPAFDLYIQEYPEISEIYKGMKGDNKYYKGCIYLEIDTYKSIEEIERKVHVYVNNSFYGDYVTVKEALTECDNAGVNDLKLQLDGNSNYYLPCNFTGQNISKITINGYDRYSTSLCARDTVTFGADICFSDLQVSSLPAFVLELNGHQLLLDSSSDIGAYNITENTNEDIGLAKNCFVKGESGSKIIVNGTANDFFCNVNVSEIDFSNGTLSFRGADTVVNIGELNVIEGGTSTVMNIGLNEVSDQVDATFDTVNLDDESLNIGMVMSGQKLTINNIVNKGEYERSIGFHFAKITNMEGADDRFSMSDITINGEYIPQNDSFLQFQLNTGESLDEVGEWIPAGFPLVRAPYLDTDNAFITVDMQQMDDDMSWRDSRSLLFTTKKDSNGYILRGDDISLFWIDDYYVTKQENGDYSLIQTKNADNCKFPEELNGVPVTEVGADHPWYYRLYQFPANINVTGTVIIPASYKRMIWYQFGQDNPTIFLGDKPEFNWDNITVSGSEADVFYLSSYSDSWENDTLLAEKFKSKGIHLYEVDVDDVLTISGNITSIADNAYQNSLEKTLKIESPVTTIGDNAFKGSSFTAAYIPSTVTRIGDTAFANCADISFFTDATYSYVLEWAKNNNKRCYVIPFDKVVEDVWSAVPNSSTTCTITGYTGSDTKVSIPGIVGGYTVTEIGEGALEDHSEIESIVIPDTVQSIGKRAFRSCSHLTDVNIPDSVIILGDNAFGECSNLKEVILPNSIISIGEAEFQGCQRLQHVVMSENITEIGNYAFSGCQRLESIQVPEKLTVLNIGVFSGCESFTDIVLPKGLIEIRSEAFDKCTGTVFGSIESVVIQDNVSYIADDAFRDCSDEMIIYCYRNSYTDIWMQNNSNFQIIYLDDKFFDPVYEWAEDNHSVTAFCVSELSEKVRKEETVATTFELFTAPTLSTKGSTVFTAEFENETFETKSKIVEDIPSLSELNVLVLPGSLITVEEEAFRGMGIQAVIIPDSCTTIGAEAFADNEEFIYVCIPKGVDVSVNAFENCKKIRFDYNE